MQTRIIVDRIAFPSGYMQRVALFFLVSVLVLIPLFWHSRIEAGDLGSHTYNSWLAYLIVHNRAPGLYLAKQWNNIAFDLLMDSLGPILGFLLAERLVVALFVLTFFWGGFTLLKTNSEGLPWHLLPALWMVSYGWTFEMGFMNFYFSMGLSFFALAMVWNGNAVRYAFALSFAVLALIAHPLGFIWLVGCSAYTRIAIRLRGILRNLLFPLALLATAAIRCVVALHYRVHDPVGWRCYRFIGADQLVLYSLRYRWLALAWVSTSVLVFVVHHEFRKREFWQRARMPVELLVLLWFATAMLWESVTLPQYAAGITFIPDRLTTGTAVILLCMLGCVGRRIWHFVAYGCCAIVFFGLLYRDSGLLCAMEGRVQTLVNSKAPNTRIVEAIYAMPGSRIGAVHLIARPCIGRCFDFTNYEPPTQQFRVRTTSLNLLVASSNLDRQQMREGRYMVRPEDLPLSEIYQCDEGDLAKLCVRDLSAGQSTGASAYIPPWLR